MAFFLKELGEMTGVEFYQLARLRTAVFVVEQACAYQEIDAIDAQAKHLWARVFRATPRTGMLEVSSSFLPMSIGHAGTLLSGEAAMSSLKGLGLSRCTCW